MSMDYYESFFEGYVATLGMGSYIFSFAVYVFEVICLWKVFEKAGKPLFLLQVVEVRIC